MTVAENVDYPLFIAGVPTAERRKRVAAQLLAVGLNEHASHRPDALSGGQRSAWPSHARSSSGHAS